MRMFVFVLLISLLVSLSACAVALTPGGQRVKLMKSDPPGNCTEIGTVTGSSSVGNVEKAKTKMRNNAAEKGANYVRFETFNGVTVGGTAFRCP